MLVNTKFGRYTIISNDIKKDKAYRKYYFCRCECGTEKWVLKYYLEKTDNPQCYSCARKQVAINAIKTRRKNGNLHRGVGIINRTIVNAFKHSAIRRNIEWALDIEYLHDLFIKQNKKCALSGLDITFCEDLKDGKYDFKEGSASLDRIDSSKGYVVGNVQWVHKHLNLMKNILKQDYFIKICKYVAEKN